MISHVAKVGVCVRDQQKALEFFTKQLGFELTNDVPMGKNARWIEVRPKGAETGLALWTPPGLENRIGTFSCIVFQSKDVQGTYEQMVAKGIKFTQPPTAQAGGLMGIFVDDDGNSFVLRGMD